ncbi:MAG: regulatory iron-sulfur-containing complex subunit RicT [Anaeroplasma sp.]|uniref:PSP1 domain-containing protein n=1 Tax=Anaeroplasma sp. TaxID=1872523 RepID=UPI002A912AE7|nr:regulatory iron-sulfur-containing complex subunit RicT [Anaeroplasma sp.]MDY5983046.1 regulatory iron-sulfur-containing complex subunit RicT [Anaeroplasma sp.]
MKVTKVQFKPLGKRYFFGVSNLDLKDKTPVVVNTIRGIEMGYCVGEPFELDPNEEIPELKDVVRIATEEDLKNYKRNKELEPDVVLRTKEFSKKENLEMKVLEAEYTLDQAKLIIYFESEGRVDFRELVKDLAEIYHTRIELRQVGSRDGAKVFGGIGPCGLIVCCQTFITQFDNVSVKMAKNQNLSLNPVKISGNCGKLLCCINYENELYTELRKDAPDIGDIVITPEGEAKVLTCDVLNKNLKVKYIGEDNKFGYFKLDEVKFTPSKDKKKKKEIEEDFDASGLE